MPQRVRRVGTASAAVSAGALVLLLSAPASPAAAAEVCKKGVDPETTIENWKCNLGNMREALTPPTPTPTPTPKPTQSKTTKKTTASKKPASTKPKAPAAKPRRPAATPGGAAAAPPAPMTGSRVPQPYSESAPPAPGLPGVLPTPEIAADPNAYRNPEAHTVAGPRTRLISPAAASPQDDGQMLLVAAAAAMAGAAAALNLSVAGRALRRRRAKRA